LTHTAFRKAKKNGKNVILKTGLKSTQIHVVKRTPPHKTSVIPKRMVSMQTEYRSDGKMEKGQRSNEFAFNSDFHVSWI
jgi:hypothetical protein